MTNEEKVKKYVEESLIFDLNNIDSLANELEGRLMRNWGIANEQTQKIKEVTKLIREKIKAN